MKVENSAQERGAVCALRASGVVKQGRRQGHKLHKADVHPWKERHKITCRFIHPSTRK